MGTSPEPIRGFLLDAARTLERPEQYLAAFNFLADRGVNRIIWHFTDDQGCQLAFRSVAGIGSPHALTVAETRQLVRAARERGIVLVPEVASLGHCRYITRLPRYAHLEEGGPEYSGLCPVHPQTREVIGALLREAMDVFDAPAVHVGLDEVEIGRHPLTRRALQSRTVAELLAEHIGFVRDVVVTEGGRKMWMWGDGLLASPELMALAPRDGVTVCNWQYTPTVDPTTTQRILNAGFNVITASALLSHDQTLFPSTGHALANVRALHAHAGLNGAGTQVRGEIVTTWFPCRSITGAQWLGWHLATGFMNGGGPADVDAAVRAFGRDFHGLAALGGWHRACRTLLDRAPRRAEWLAVLGLHSDALPPAVGAALPAAAEAWRSAHRDLRAVADDVRHHRPEFDALSLLVELIAHAYAAAATVARDATPADLASLVTDRADLLDRLESAWVAERFPDDPARTVAAVEAFHDDHLLLSVRDGLDRLNDLLEIQANDPVPAVPVAVQ